MLDNPSNAAPIGGSYMHQGDRPRFWSFYDDEFLGVSLAAEPAADRVIARNEQLADFLHEGHLLNDMAPYTMFPPALAGSITRLQTVPCVMTGGRTFLPTAEGNANLGWPEKLHLDLDKLGWGHGLLEVRPEVKGAGTLFERTRLRGDRMDNALSNHPDLLRSYRAECAADAQTPQLMSSRGAFMNRVIGGQNEKNAVQGVIASAVQLGKSEIKFVPVWMAVAQSPAVHANLGIVSNTLPATMERFDGVWASEIRLSPGNVRAAYFDKAESDEELVALCSRVSDDPDELDETLEEMIADARRYLDVVATTTMPAAGGAFTWVKIGDINEKFEDKRLIEKFRRQRFAWFLAKDEVVVRRVGKFFTDMESYFGKDVGYTSASWADLLVHHELFALTVLRDHLRVCARFALACDLLAGRSLERGARRRLSADIRRRIIDAVNKSSHLHLSQRAGDRSLDLQIRYRGVGDDIARFNLSADELAETYA